MAATLTKTFFSGDIVRGGEQGIVELIGTINLGTYATGGIAVDFANVSGDLDNANLLFIGFEVSDDLTTYGVYDRSAEKIVAYVRADDLQVADTTDLSAAGKHLPCRAVFRISSAVSTNITL